MKRELGVDVLKIVSMLLIVLTHCLGHGGVIESTEPLSSDYCVYTFINYLTHCCVPCYGMATGYLYYEKKMKIKSIINLWIQVVFYSILIMGVFCLFDFRFFSIKRMIMACVPLFTEYWYFVAYFGLFMCIPMLNVAIEKMQRKDLIKLLSAIFIFVYTLTSIRHYDMFGFNGGTSTIGLISFYIIGAYIKKYNVTFKSKRVWYYLLLALLLNYLVYISIAYLNVCVFGVETIPKNYFASWISPFNMIYSILVFGIVVRKHQYNVGLVREKIVVALSNATFGVYLIHENVFVRENVISKVSVIVSNTNVSIGICVLFVIVIVIYILCSVLELLRQKLFSVLDVDRFVEKTAIFLDRFCRFS